MMADIPLSLSSSNNMEKILLEETEPFSPQFLQLFSDISPQDLKMVKNIWSKVSRERKSALLIDLEKLMRVDTLVSCDDFGLYALDDDDPTVKSLAIDLLWECSDLNLASRFIKILEEDKDPELSAAAASGLGKFVLLGELEEIPADTAKKILDTLVKKYLSNGDQRLKQSILESLGYVSNSQIDGFIKEAIQKPEKDWILSALFAIGRSANTDWSKTVLEKLDDLDPEVQLEAIKAAGELEISEAKEIISEILEGSSPEDEIHLQSIWSLSMIGGNDVLKLFNKLYDSSDSEKETAMLEMAMDNLELTNSFDELDIFDED